MVRDGSALAAVGALVCCVGHGDGAFVCTWNENEVKATSPSKFEPVTVNSFPFVGATETAPTISPFLRTIRSPGGDAGVDAAARVCYW